MFDLKQSTTITVPFFLHDAAGDAVAGKVDGDFTKRISKNGGAFAAMTVTITELENGWYSMPLSTSHSDTAGALSITFTVSGAKQVNLQFRVYSEIANNVIGAPAGASISADIAATPTLAELQSEINDVQADIAALNDPTAASIADAILGRNLAGGSDGGRTVRQALRALRNRVAISGGTMTVYQENDSTSDWTAAVTTAAGNPVSEIDPA
jgi:hypothetical protein